jgi:CheY-like chemotaxis protein
VAAPWRRPDFHPPIARTPKVIGAPSKYHSATRSDKSRALAAGFDYHLTKPLSLEKLQYILANRTEGKLGGLV